MKIVHIVGTRPNFVKVAPIYKALDRHTSIEQVIIHTGQHYDHEMSLQFFTDITIPKPDINLGVRKKSNSQQVAHILMLFEKVCLKEKPDLILVVGDSNPTISGSLVGRYLKIPTAHVEAGLRSFDNNMPEEINRIITDHCSDILFTTEESAGENLLHEGIPKERIHFVGNVMIDTLMTQLPIAKHSKILDSMMLAAKKYALLTLHRPSNVDDAVVLEQILRSVAKINTHFPIVFPVHPRTQKKVRAYGLQRLMDHFIITNPLPYNDFLSLMSSAKLVLTDSGGIQEETTFLKIPCLTLRENTERPVTLTFGTSELVGKDYKKMLQHVVEITSGVWKKGSRPPFWDGKAAERISDIIRSYKKYLS